MPVITKTTTGATFRVRVQEDALKLRINAPPVKGKASKALIDFLAKELGVKKSEIEILSGHTGRIKTIQIVGERGEIEKRIQTLLGIAKETT